LTGDGNALFAGGPAVPFDADVAITTLPFQGRELSNGIVKQVRHCGWIAVYYAVGHWGPPEAIWGSYIEFETQDIRIDTFGNSVDGVLWHVEAGGVISISVSS
jgi:hypothetical protein